MTRPALYIPGGWIVILLVMSLLWHVPVLTGSLPDTDDYMRMERVFAIVDGQDLPSYAVPGLGLDEKGEVGWSRLVDWPLAALQGGLERYMDRFPAAMLTATIMPALALLLFLAAACWYARPLTAGKDLYTVLAVLFVWALLRQFMPGRVDHHMWQAILAVLAYGALVRIWPAPESRIYPVIAGFAFATGLAIGADIIPALFCGAALLGFFWLARGGAYERAGLLFGAAVFSATVFYHLWLHDPGRFWTSSCDSLSAAWTGLAAAVFLFWAFTAGLPSALKAGMTNRFLCGLAVFAPLMGALYLIFPACFTDLYRIENPVLERIWLAEVAEILSLPAYWKVSPAAAAMFAVPPAMAFAASLWAACAEKDRRVLWTGLALVLACALALTFLHVRTVDFAQAVSVAPLAWLLLTVRGRAAHFINRFTEKQREAGAALFFMTALAFFAFAFVQGSKVETQPEIKAPSGCSIREASTVLNTLPAPLTIAGPVYAGSQLLFRTGHKVLAASCHRNQEGILAVYEIFTAPDEQAARQAVARANAGILMLCQRRGNIWAGLAAEGEAFAASLLAGNVPDWLEPVGAPEQNGGYLIFRIE